MSSCTHPLRASNRHSRRRFPRIDDFFFSPLAPLPTGPFCCDSLPSTPVIPQYLLFYSEPPSASLSRAAIRKEPVRRHFSALSFPRTTPVRSLPVSKAPEVTGWRLDRFYRQFGISPLLRGRVVPFSLKFWFLLGLFRFPFVVSYSSFSRSTGSPLFPPALTKPISFFIPLLPRPHPPPRLFLISFLHEQSSLAFDGLPVVSLWFLGPFFFYFYPRT